MVASSDRFGLFVVEIVAKRIMLGDKDRAAKARMHSILINTYERPLILSRCLEALSRQKGIDGAEVIVVDDGSSADFKAIERLYKTRMNLRYIKIRHAGRSAARNRGARAAEGERLLFLGDDVIVRPGWLARHLERGAGQPKLAVLGPYPLEKPDAYPPAFRAWADSVHLDRIADPENVGFEFFVTGNLSMDRALFLEAGGFDERFKVYGWEDIDLGLRFARAGGRIVYDENAKAHHAHPRMSRADLWRRERESGATAWQFWAKWNCEEAQFMKFWGERPAPGPAWRRAAARAAIAAIERVAPSAAILPKLYERLVYSYRHLGASEAMRGGAGEAAP